MRNQTLLLMSSISLWISLLSGIRKIKESLYAPFKEKQFGFQKIASIQLCQMGDKREDGYYAVNKEVTWQSEEPS